MSPRFIAILLLALAPLACRQPTQLLVVVESDYQVPEELGQALISVLNPNGEPVSEPRTLTLVGAGSELAADHTELPFSFGVAPPGGDSKAAVTVVVEGRASGSTTCASAVRRRVNGFTEGESLLLPLFLSRVCNLGCSMPESAACSGDVEPGALKPISPGDELNYDGGHRGGRVDAGVADGGADDAGAPDQGTRDGATPDSEVTDAEVADAGSFDSCVPASTRTSAPSMAAELDMDPDAIPIGPPRRLDFDLAVNPSGTAIVVWSRANARQPTAQVFADPITNVASSALLTSDPRPADLMSVAIAPNGSADAVWRQGVVPGNLKSSHYQNGEWGPVQVVGDSNEYDPTSRALLALAESDTRAVVVYTTTVSAPNGRRLFLRARSSTISGWGASQEIHSAGGGELNRIDDVQLAMNRNGDALLVWVEATALPWSLMAAASPASDGASWTLSPIELSTSAYALPVPRVSVLPNGDAVISYRDVQRADERIKVVRYDHGAGNFSASITLSTASPVGTSAAIAGDSCGGTWALWSEAAPNDIAPLMSKRYRTAPPVGWSVQPPLSTSYVSDHPTLAVNPGADAVAVWWRSSIPNGYPLTGGPANPLDLMYAFYYGGNWTAASSIYFYQALSSIPKVGIDDMGRGRVVWLGQEPTGGAYHLRMRRFQ